MIQYLDYNASTPIDTQVVDCIMQVYKDIIGNADSRTHKHGEQAKQVVENARLQIATLLGVLPKEVYFTSGATESNNLAILGLQAYANTHGKNHMVSTVIEHKSVLEPLMQLQKQGIAVDFAKPNGGGSVSCDAMIDLIKPHTALVTMQQVNNETGVVQPIQEVGEYCKAKGVWFHIDAAQSFGKMVEELRRSSYDMLSVSGHKIYGPQGIGALVLKTKNYKRPPLCPLVFGGGQENGMRPGTSSVALIAGFGKAAELANHNYKKWQQHCHLIKTSVLQQLSQSKARYTINGDQTRCVNNTLNLSFEGINSEALLLALKSEYSVSNGSACTSKDYQPSFVLQAMGLAPEIIASAIRLSWGKDTPSINLDPMLSIVQDMQSC
ncbi:MAG: aminotransferase class V-fold PLP-dependent enzyme [Firmicutes bacterium]|nr:aminotransferase class V-fold PLP-dependent enzyme [Bacillota bacterium]